MEGVACAGLFTGMASGVQDATCAVGLGVDHDVPE